MPTINFAAPGVLGPIDGLTFAWPLINGRSSVTFNLSAVPNPPHPAEPGHQCPIAWEFQVTSGNVADLSGVAVQANYATHGLTNPVLHKGPNGPGVNDKIPESWWVGMVTTAVTPNALATLSNLPDSHFWLALGQ